MRFGPLALLLVACTPFAHPDTPSPTSCSGPRCVSMPACAINNMDPEAIGRTCRQSCEHKTDCPTGFACREESRWGRTCQPCGQVDCMPPAAEETAEHDDDADCPCTTE